MAIRNNVSVTTAETAVEFDARYPFMWVRNLGDTDCYASIASGFDVSGVDVALVKAGEVVRVFVPDAVDTKSIYIKTASGSTTVDVHAENESTCPFKRTSKGGGGGGGDITVESLSVTDNGIYTAPSGKAYSPVSVDVQPTLGTKSITTNGTYTASSDNLDGYSSVTVNVYPYGDVLFDNLSASDNNATLSKAYTNYEEIILIAAFGGNTIVTQKIPTSQIAIGNNIGICTDTSYLWLKVVSTTSFTQHIESYDGTRLVKIIGMGEISND